MNKILIVYNPRAGKGKGLKYAEGLKEHLANADIACSKSLDTLQECYKDKKDYSLIAIIGGDGTIGPHVDAMIKSGVDVPIYPLGRGTANDFSSYLKTNVSVKRAAKIIAGGRIIDADTLKVGADYAINNAAGGAFTNGVTNYKGKKIFGKLAYIIQAGWHALWMKAQKVRFTVDNDIFEENIFLFYIVNTKNVGGISGAGTLAEINDGMLDLVCIKKCRLWGKICVGLSALCGRLHKSKRVIYRQGKRFRVEIIGTPIHNFTKTDMDGKIGGDYPLNVEIGPKIRVISKKVVKNC